MDIVYILDDWHNNMTKNKC